MRTIAQISDLHFGHHDSRKADDLVESLHAASPDLVIASGDFTQRARQAEFAEACRFLDRLPQPKLVVPGNHDLPLFNLLRRFRRPLKHYHRYIAPHGPEDDFFGDAEIAVLGLSTPRRLLRKGGRVSFEQVDHIMRVFRAVPQGVFKAVVTHHPLGSPEVEGKVTLAGRSGRALKALAEVDVHLLLSGHGHRPMSGSVRIETDPERSVLVLHAGTAISTRTRGGYDNSYNLVRVDGDAVSIRVMAWSEAGFRAGETSDYRVEHGRWRKIR